MGTIFTYKTCCFRKEYFAYKKYSAWSCSQSQLHTGVQTQEPLIRSSCFIEHRLWSFNDPINYLSNDTYTTYCSYSTHMCNIFLLLSAFYHTTHITQAHHFHATDKKAIVYRTRNCGNPVISIAGGPDSAMSSRPQRISRANYVQVLCFVYREVFQQFYCMNWISIACYSIFFPLVIFFVCFAFVELNIVK